MFYISFEYRIITILEKISGLVNPPLGVYDDQKTLVFPWLNAENRI